MRVTVYKYCGGDGRSRELSNIFSHMLFAIHCVIQNNVQRVDINQSLVKSPTVVGEDMCLTIIHLAHLVNGRCFAGL